MRTRHSVLIAALLLASAPAYAQQAQQAAPVQPASPAAKPSTDILGGIVQKGEFEIGVVGSSVDGDEARFQRYRDLRNGPAADRFRFTRDEGTLFIKVGADHIGRRDQRYSFNIARPGKLKASFTYDQIPLFLSNDTALLFSDQGNGVFLIDDAIQQGIQNKQLTLLGVAGQAKPFTMKSRRDTAAVNLLYSATRELDLKFNLKTFTREGSQPWGASLGFSNDIELPLPLDSRTTDVNTSLEWTNQQASFSAGYLGSWYDNKIQTLRWDNPIKFTDSTYSSAYSPGDGTSLGQMAIFPSNSMNAVFGSGSVKLPARSSASAYVSVGSMNQNQPLLPFTVNTAIPALHLDRTTAEAQGRMVSTNLAFTSRPSQIVWLNARYRYYDLNDRTPTFDGVEYVRFDQVVEEEGGHREPFSIKRQNFDVDASFTPVGYTAFKIGYGRAQGDRTSRIFGKTVENTLRASVDTTGNQYVSLRTTYEHSARRGHDFEPEILVEAAEQPGMRHFDIASRDRDRVVAIATLTPVSQLGLNFSVGAGKDTYGETVFGLRDNKNRLLSAGFDVVPSDKVTFSLEYGFEKFTALQISRSASPDPSQFDDPRRNWTDDSADKTHSINGSLDLVRVFPNTDVRLGYDYSKSRATYVYSLAANTVLAAVSQLPAVRHEQQRATIDAQHFVTKRVAVGFVYWFDKYTVDDFALNGAAVRARAVPGSLFLGYMYRPYKANTGWFKVSYLW